MKRVNNNIKFYTFIDILKSYSDKNVSLSIKEIQHHMQKRLGVNIDRRTIYGYIKDMKDLGIDVSDYDKNKEGYYLNSNCFEEYEIRILTDAILTSNFVTKKKTLELVKKLKSFNSIYQNKDFLKNIYIEDIPKSNNEEIFTNIAKIDEAIKLGKKIKFNYCNYDYCKNLVYRLDDEGNPKEYVKSPVYMILRNKNYYLVCAEENLGVFQNFRVDRMINTCVMNDEEIIDLSQFEDCRNGLNPMEYLRKNLKMFSGRSNIMIVEFRENLLNCLLDEFGEYMYIMEKENYEKNNLSESMNHENIAFQILKKVMGKKDYQDYVLSGKYMKNNSEREKIDNFIKEMDDFVNHKYENKGINISSDEENINCGEEIIDIESRASKKIKDCKNVASCEKYKEELNCEKYKEGVSNIENINCSNLIDDKYCKYMGVNVETKSENCKNNKTIKKECQIENFGEICKIVDGCTDKRGEKIYIGIFVAKESMGLTKWLMQFGTDIKVIWPESMRNLMFCQINKLRKFYLEDNGKEK